VSNLINEVIKLTLAGMEIHPDGSTKKAPKGATSEASKSNSVSSTAKK